MTPQPTLYIITGPPGSGKTTYAQEVHPTLHVYDHDLGNKEGWRGGNQPAVFMASAPTRDNKEYWTKEARREGYSPTLTTIWIDRMKAYERMSKRSGASPTQRNNLVKGVERWYKMYSAHPLEIRYEPETRS